MLCPQYVVTGATDVVEGETLDEGGGVGVGARVVEVVRLDVLFVTVVLGLLGTAASGLSSATGSGYANLRRRFGLVVGIGFQHAGYGMVAHLGRNHGSLAAS